VVAGFPLWRPGFDPTSDGIYGGKSDKGGFPPSTTVFSANSQTTMCSTFINRSIIDCTQYSPNADWSLNN
jgi:hypothetical protein